MPKITVITTKVPSFVGKTVSAAPNESVKKEIVMNYRRGEYRVAETKTPEALVDLITSLKAGKQYLVCGLPEKSEGTFAADYLRTGDEVMKGNDSFPFRPEPGLMVIDSDSAVTPDDMARLLDLVGLGSAAFVWWPSSSSYIYRQEKQISGLKGSHTYILVEDATDIPRAGRSIFRQFWLHGHGYIKVSSAGVPLSRSPYDEAMLKPSQPCFSAGAYCIPFVSQHRGDPVIMDGTDIVNTRDLVRDLTAEEDAQVDLLIMQAKVDAEGICAPVRAAHLEDQIRRAVIEEIGADASEAQVKARMKTFDRRAIERVLTGGVDHLPLDWVLTLKDGTRITVEAVLEGGMKYHGAVCYDPMNPEYLSGILYLDGRPNLHSQANLKPTWQLGTKLERDLMRHNAFINADALKKAMGL